MAEEPIAYGTAGEGLIDYDPRGLKDNPHFYIHCSSCGKTLGDCWPVYPKELAATKKKVKIKCPCGDASFITEVPHPSMFGPGASLVWSDMEEDERGVTVITAVHQ